MIFVTIQLTALLILFGIAILTAMTCRKLFGDPEAVSGRLTYFEGLRALSALAVASSHINQEFIKNLGFTQLPLVSNHFGILGVKMFFGLTAFLFTRRVLFGKMDIVAFFSSRIRRIVPLYFFVCTIAVFIIMTATVVLYHQKIGDLQQIFNEIYSVFTFGFFGGPRLEIKGYNMLSLVGTAWTLPYEWAFYLLIPILVIFTQSRSLIWCGFTIFVIATANAYFITPENVWPFFLSGVIAAFLEKYMPPIHINLERFFGIAAVFLLSAILFAPKFFTLLQLVLATLLFLCIFLAKPNILQKKILQYLAQISYSVYLLQFLVLLPLVTLFNGIHFLQRSMMTTIACILTMVILIPLSHLTYKLIELPWMRPGTSSFWRKSQADGMLNDLKQQPL